jgi:uncharacterized protein YmfQ (DUF2313 family)
MNVAAYARQLRQLLPPGRLWNLEPDSNLSKLMLSIAEELARVDARGLVLIEESDPRTATETLDEWERMLGLPDEDVLEVPSTTEARRQAIISKLLRLGGQSRAYYVTLAAACGYEVSIYDGYGAELFRVNRQRMGDRLYGPEWAHTWKVTVQPPTGSALTTDELERILRRVAPAHTVVIFEYA